MLARYCLGFFSKVPVTFSNFSDGNLTQYLLQASRVIQYLRRSEDTVYDYFLLEVNSF